MKLVLHAFFVLIIVATGDLNAGGEAPASSLFSRGYHVHKFNVHPTSAAPIGYENAMNKTMEMELHSGGRIFYLDLALKTRQWGKNARIITMVDENGNPTQTQPLFHRGYTGSASVVTEDGHHESGSASVTFFEDGRATLAVSTKHDLYNIDLNEFNDGSLRLDDRNTGLGMFMTKFSDLEIAKEDAREVPSSSLSRNLRRFLQTKPGARHLNQLIPFDNCFSGQSGENSIKIGLMSDKSYEEHAGNASQASTKMIGELNKASDLVFSEQLRVWLTAGDVYTGNGVPSSISNGSSGPPCASTDSINDRLSTFRTWREGLGKDGHALYHLFTNCYPPPGTTGLGMVGVLCDPRHGVSVSNVVTGTSWLTFAHELGHNFNAHHTFENGQGKTGGIMDYGDGYYPAPGVAPTSGREIAFHPDSQTEICAGITDSMSGSSWLIPRDECWTTTGVPAPTPAPTTAPPASSPSGNTGTAACTGITLVVPWHFSVSATCEQYTAALQAFKPCIQTVTSCEMTGTWGPYTMVSMTFVTSQAEYTSFNWITWTNGVQAELANMGITLSRQQLQVQDENEFHPTAQIEEINGDPVLTYKWIRHSNATYSSCSPSCGNFRYQLPLFVCQQTATFPGDTIAPMTIIVSDESLCGLNLKPIGLSGRCASKPCDTHWCGNGELNWNEVCDTGMSSCCAADCQSWLNDPMSCMTRNKMIDAMFMMCLNDVEHTGCYLYVFQGKYFMKYTPQFERSWVHGPIKHRGVFQNKWDQLTAVAGGENGQVWVFHGLEYLRIDFSHERSSKTMGSGTIGDTIQVPHAFVECGSVTAADIVRERLLILFCRHIFVYVDMVTLTAHPANVFPVDLVFGTSGEIAVNAFYFDRQDYTYKIVRRDVLSGYKQPGLHSNSFATVPSIFGVGNGLIPTWNCDPECTICNGNTCTECAEGYKLVANQCVSQLILIDMEFSKNSVNDAHYSSSITLTNAVFTTGHGNETNGAMVFTPATRVLAHASSVKVGETIPNFKFLAFVNPYFDSFESQRLVTIDDRFVIGLKSQNTSWGLTLCAEFDQMKFELDAAGSAVLVGEWNVIVVEYVDSEIVMSVNGARLIRAFDETLTGEPPRRLGLTFQNVTIGAEVGGFDGAMDSLQIIQLSPRTSSLPSSSVQQLLFNWIGVEREKRLWRAYLVVTFGLILGALIVCGKYRPIYATNSKRLANGNDELSCLLSEGESENRYIAIQ